MQMLSSFDVVISENKNDKWLKCIASVFLSVYLNFLIMELSSKIRTSHDFSGLMRKVILQPLIFVSFEKVTTLMTIKTATSRKREDTKIFIVRKHYGMKTNLLNL